MQSIVASHYSATELQEVMTSSGVERCQRFIADDSVKSAGCPQVTSPSTNQLLRCFSQ